ncbi:FIVAR domain-containing protein [Brevibacillus laterosporus]|uniref:FIVAR domain-containing protein n=1 Tax=Brevibacillus laterosporus TaxID=1465 RepID=UPI0003B1A57B|nr:FIVAR domain-containing protein [Brevibacillus laterosporus]ERM17088.1 hypothetical protein P615_03725 [Brevibacillus laterosporus PE36]
MKKVVLSVLSTALVTSMATSAFAASTGYYLGGNVTKYYGADALINADVAAKFKEEAFKSSLTQDQVLFVNPQGKVASLKDIVDAIDNGQTGKDAFRVATGADFDKIGGTDGFHTVLEDGTVDSQKNKVPEQDGQQPTGDLKVESVSAINSTTVKVTFAQAVVAIAKEDVTVVNKDTGNKEYVKAVTLSDDKKSATVEFYQSLTKGSYTATVKAGDKTSSKDFDFVVGEVAKVEVQTSQVVSTKAADKKITYKLLDAAGVDVTAENKAKVKFEATAPIDNEGNITLNTDGAIAFVYVTVTKDDGTVVKSEKITVKAEDPKPMDLINWTVSTSIPTFDSSEYKQNTLVSADANPAFKFHVELKDQFGNKYTDIKPQYESLDKTVVLVDREEGTVTPLKDGLTPVKISVVKADGKVLYSKTVEIKTVAKAVTSKLELKETEVTVSSSLGTTKTVVVKFKDQYGNDIAHDGKVFVQPKSGQDLIKPLVKEQTVNGTDKKEHSITIEPEPGKEGTAVIELSLNDQIKAELTVKVEKAGQVSDFKVNGFEKELDKNTANKDAKSQMELKVFSVDDKGNQAEEITNGLFYSVTDATGKEIATTAKIDATQAEFEAGKEYTVTVKMGADKNTAYQLFSDKFTVKDTKELPKVSLTKGTISVDVTKGSTIKENVDLKDLFAVTFTGAEASDITVEGFDFLSDNDAVISSKGNATTPVKKDGTASLIIKSVDVKVKTTDYKVQLNNEVVKLEVKGQAAAEALTAAKAAVTALEEAAGKDLTVEVNLTAAENAVKTANEAVGKLADGTEKTALQGKVNTAKNTVETARTAFDNKGKEAAELQVAKTALENAISDAKAAHTAAVVGSDAGQYEQGAKDTYNTAIETAENVFKNASSTKAQLEQAKADLDAATATFKLAEKK